MKIFFDLDGTLIDSKSRLYELFQFLVQQSNLSFHEYWELKQNKKSHEFILSQFFKYSESQIAEFNGRWMNLIESKEYLLKDKAFEFTKKVISDLAIHHELYVVTARQDKNRAIQQVDTFIGKNYFREILVTEQKYSKIELIENKISVSASDWIVGDTGKDIETGRLLGLRTIAVLSGFLNEQSLIPYKPDYIFDNIFKIDCFQNGKYQKSHD